MAIRINITLLGLVAIACAMVVLPAAGASAPPTCEDTESKDEGPGYTERTQKRSCVVYVDGNEGSVCVLYERTETERWDCEPYGHSRTHTIYTNAVCSPSLA